MSHIAHGFKISKKNYSLAIFVLTLLVPVISLVIIGHISQIALNDIFLNILVSLLRLLGGYLISLVLAVALALLIDQSKLGEIAIPVFDLMQNLPSFALIPIFATIFGYTNFMAIVFAATSIIWPILFYVLNAIKTAPKDLNNASYIFGARGLKRALFYYLPLSFPAIITGSIVGFSIGWEAIIGMEIIGLNNGIGSLLNNSISQSKPFFALGLTALLVLVFIINRLVWMPLLKKAQNYAI